MLGQLWCIQSCTAHGALLWAPVHSKLTLTPPGKPDPKSKAGPRGQDVHRAASGAPPPACPEPLPGSLAGSQIPAYLGDLSGLFKSKC